MRIIVAQKCIQAYVLQPIVPFSPIPPFILCLHDVPQETCDEDVCDEIAQGLKVTVEHASKRNPDFNNENMYCAMANEIP